jgi:hypothetical protein
MQIEVRSAVYREPASNIPAVVLVPDTHDVYLTPLQLSPLVFEDKDFARNGVDFNSSVLYGRDIPEYYGTACALRGGTVFLWRWQGPSMERLPCH